MTFFSLVCENLMLATAKGISDCTYVLKKFLIVLIETASSF